MAGDLLVVGYLYIVECLRLARHLSVAGSY